MHHIGLGVGKRYGPGPGPPIAAFSLACIDLEGIDASLVGLNRIAGEVECGAVSRQDGIPYIDIDLVDPATVTLGLSPGTVGQRPRRCRRVPGSCLEPG